MSVYPDDRRYSRSHEWIRVDGDVGTIGISDHAQKELGEVVFVDMPDVGEIFDAGQEFGTIESVKAVSELFLPVAGEIIELNAVLADEPGAVNEDPHGDGWLVKIKLSSDAEMDLLLSAADYEKFVEEEAKAADRRSYDQMRYIPNSPAERESLLAAVGASSIDELFATVPRAVYRREPPGLPPPASEIEVRRDLGRVAAKNAHLGDWTSFLGAGLYSHHSPAFVSQLLLRGEFLTSYTPYQAEVAQGTLTAIWEFQTHIALLTGLDVANASMYEGASAFVEAVLMAERLTKKKDEGRRLQGSASRVPAVPPHVSRELPVHDRRGPARKGRHDGRGGARGRRRRHDVRGRACSLRTCSASSRAGGPSPAPPTRTRRSRSPS